jgi:anti-anti-sigma factor
MTVPPDEGAGFEAAVDFVGEQVVLNLRGVLDDQGVPGLAALFESMITSGHRVIIVDLDRLESMTPAGLAVIAGASQRMTGRAGRFIVRSPSLAVRQLLDSSGLVGLARTHSSDLVGGRPASEQAPDHDHAGADPAGRPPLGPDPLVHGLHDATSLPTTDDVVDGSLRLMVALARATVGGADGVSVSLRRHGRLSTVAASDQTVLEMDAQQYATGEGPCVDASVEGRWFHVESLDTETRWPTFVPQARALGINAILSSPLLASTVPVGSINIYSRTASAFDAEDQRLATVFATEASAVLTDAGLDLSDEERSARFQDALLTREVIAQAQGVLMERDGIGEDEAYTLLRIHSQRTGQPLHRRAQDVTASARRPSGDRPAGWRQGHRDGLRG